MEVTYIDHMGDDLRVVNAARVSFHKESDWEYGFRIEHEGKEHGMVSLSEADQKLLRYLAKNAHFTPFTHVVITMHERVPIFVARQRFKHMVGFSYNEVSRRYVDSDPEFFIPTEWRRRAENVKQGSSDEVIEYLALENNTQVRPFPKWFMGEGRPKVVYEKFLKMAEELYNEMIASGVAPEQARMVLPQSMMTEYYTTGSLSAWSRMINLRKDSHAQKEIQHLAQLCDEIIRGLPELKHSWEALVGDKWY